jgi:hypothetical protein
LPGRCTAWSTGFVDHTAPHDRSHPVKQHLHVCARLAQEVASIFAVSVGGFHVSAGHSWDGHVTIDDGAYVVVKAAVYERLRSLLETGPLSIEEQKAMIAHIGKRAGWDDPRMDVYNDLDPRLKP